MSRDKISLVHCLRISVGGITVGGEVGCVLVSDIGKDYVGAVIISLREILLIVIILGSNLVRRGAAGCYHAVAGTGASAGFFGVVGLAGSKENRTNKQKAHLLEANRLYNRMQLETAPQLKKMQDLVSTLYKEDKPENEKELLAELTLIGAYFKRRNNLLFISETQDTIRMAELGYCFRESVSALELQGVTGSCLVEAQGNISLSESIQLYDAFQSVLQKTFSCINSIAVFLRTAESGFEMCISLHLTTEMTFQFDSDFRIEQEEENDYLLTYFVARGDGDGK